MLGSQFLPVPPKPCLSKSGPSCLGMALGSYTGANPTRCRFRLRNEIDAQGVTVGQYLEQHLRNGWCSARRSPNSLRLDWWVRYWRFRTQDLQNLSLSLKTDEVVHLNVVGSSEVAMGLGMAICWLEHATTSIHQFSCTFLAELCVDIFAEGVGGVICKSLDSLLAVFVDCFKHRKDEGKGRPSR